MQAPVLPFFLPHAFPPSLPPEKQASHNAINTKADCIRSCLAQLLSPSIHRFETILSEAISAFVSVNTNILATTQEKPKYSDGNKRGKAPSNQTSKPATRAASTFSEQARDRLYHDQQEQRDISLHPLPYPVPLFLPLRKKFTRKWTAPPSPALNSCSVTVTLARYRCRAARPVISPQPRPARRPARRSTRQSAARTTVPAGRRRRQRGRQTPAESHRQQTISGCNKCIQQLQ